MPKKILAKIMAQKKYALAIMLFWIAYTNRSTFKFNTLGCPELL